MHSPAKNPTLTMRSYNMITQCILIRGSGARQRLLYYNMEHGRKTTMHCQLPRVSAPVTYEMFRMEASSSVCTLKLLQRQQKDKQLGWHWS